MEVEDTGVGMSEDVLGQLFDPFFTTKEKGKGTGLGLATVYGIVKQSGGDISVRSVIDEGSSFRVYLPHASDQDAGGIGSVRPGGGTERVLLVEDEDAVRSLVRETLRRYGYEVTDAADADGARRALESSRPDILVTDIVMPGLGGHELAALVRERHPAIAVLYMSGYTDDAIVRSTLADPRSVFLQKPFGAETLARKVREALDARKA
jgi:CheY-like chemotaxis protein